MTPSQIYTGKGGNSVNNNTTLIGIVKRAPLNANQPRFPTLSYKV